MRATIVPFASDHLEPAAALLATRHCRDRAEVPDLPPTCEDVDATLPVLRELVAGAGMRGVVAFRTATHVGSGFRHPRSAQSPYAAHAVDAEGGHLYSLHCAALSGRWVAKGLLGHYAQPISGPTTPLDGARSRNQAHFAHQEIAVLLGNC